MSNKYILAIETSSSICGAAVIHNKEVLSIFEKEFWAFLKKEKATSISGVPYTYDILKKLRFTRMELPYLKTLTQAGGKINETLHRYFAEFLV